MLLLVHLFSCILGMLSVMALFDTFHPNLWLFKETPKEIINALWNSTHQAGNATKNKIENVVQHLKDSQEEILEATKETGKEIWQKGKDLVDRGKEHWTANIRQREDEERGMDYDSFMRMLYDYHFHFSPFDRFSHFPSFPSRMERKGREKEGKAKKEKDFYHSRFDPFGKDGKIQIREYKNYYIYTIETPGIPRHDLEIYLHHNVIHMKGHHNFTMFKDNENQEPFFFEKTIEDSISLPDNVNLEKIEATLRDGMLYIKVEKSKDHEKRIAVHDHSAWTGKIADKLGF